MFSRNAWVFVIVFAALAFMVAMLQAQTPAGPPAAGQADPAQPTQSQAPGQAQPGAAQPGAAQPSQAQPGQPSHPGFGARPEQGPACSPGAGPAAVGAAPAQPSADGQPNMASMMMSMCPMMARMMGQAGADQPTRMPVIGDTAPAFEANSSQGPIRFPEDFPGKWIILFSHPADFTPVCTTEFVMFASMTPQFRQLNCELIGLSVDSNPSHIAWLRTIREQVEYKGISGINVTFPVVEDISMNVARQYGMIQPGASTTQTVRTVFVIDPKQKIRAVLYYPMSTGRNIDEIMRLLIALQTSDQYKVSIPANWMPGDDVIVPPPGSCGSADQRTQNPQAGDRVMTWFLTFRPLPREQVDLPASFQQAPSQAPSPQQTPSQQPSPQPRR